ncbi:MAG: hypothetical protein ABJC61_03940, partial [Acidobacteriota bacterium]
MALTLFLVPCASGETLPAAEEQVRERLSGISVAFIANSRQTDAAVAYYAPTFSGTVFVTKHGQIVYSLPGKKEADPEARGEAKPSGRPIPPEPGASPGWSLTETPVGGKARPLGAEPSHTHVSYFIGNDPSRWRSGLATFEGVSLGEVWPGISLELRAHGNNVEKLFTVKAGGDPSRIRMRIAGAGSLRTDDAGALVASTGSGDVTFTPPAAYQQRDGARRKVEVAYRVRSDGYGFRLGDYDPALPVVIDPLLQATYLGGNGTDYVLALAIHPTSGNVYVAGYANSTNFPGTTGGLQPANGGNNDAFVARLTADLTTLTKATYLGGSGGDTASALAIHPTSGDVYVAGYTFSTNFPGTTGGAQAANGGKNDAF